MGTLTLNHNNNNKRGFDSQFNDYTHLSKRLKSSPPYFGSKPVVDLANKRSSSSSSSVSRLSLYPKLVTPISKQIQAPCSIVKGFVKKKQDNNSLVGNHRMGNILFGAKTRRDKDGSLVRMEANYKRAKGAAKSSCKFVTFDIEDDDDDEVVEVVNVDNVVKDDDGSGGSEVVMMESGGRDEGDKSCEVQTIRAKYRELDGRAKGLGIVSDMLDGKSLESLSLSDVGTPYHKKLWNDSAKRDSTLTRRGYDIKLLEEKRASLKKLAPQKKQEDLLEEPFRELTEDDRKLVANALSNASRRKVLVTHENSNITITGEVLRCLGPGAWLNDEVINLYLELLKERERREPKKFLKCHFFNTFFYKKLISGRGGYDYNSVRRWTSKRKLGYSLLECDKIFVPVHKEIHWCLAVINKKEKKFQYLDSLGGIDRQVMGVLEQYIVDEVKDKNGEDIDVTSWKQEFVTDLPNQQNGFDCGVFMIKYADFYSRDIGLCFKQENMPYFRLRTAKEILKLRAD
ncbi:cysteine proteinases superfamily protein [Artemisia annua]|uniref:Cysteine proteinases superfamily protein n=1 Tax=Artemisia annua TaxID=35608 RepID=A0A2U1LAK4_ARTAN|nr:cysteine proteinases superfamily protein [Artemisia annua]